MQLLTLDDSSALTDLMIDNLPQVVLDTLCRASGSGITQGGLVCELTRTLPSAVSADEVRDHAQASLYWFLFNGDIAAAGSGQRYRIVPPYAVALPPLRGQATGERQIQLCGDPRRDPEIQKLLADEGGRWTSETIVRQWKIADAYPTVPVGIRRSVTLAPDRIVSSRSRLQAVRVPMLEVQDLERALPNIAALTVPPRSAFRALAPTSGLWSYYAPAQAGADRWMKVEALYKVPASQIVRWMSSDDWRGQRDSRYFYKGDFPEPAELSYSAACLWKFHIDQQQSRPRLLWSDGHQLRLPVSIPDPHRQWLQLLASNLRWRDSILHFELGVDPEPVSQTLAATLGLQIVRQRPT